MTRIDWLVLKRIGSRVLVTVFVFYGIIALVESLDTWRFNYLSERNGMHVAVLAIVFNAVKWTIKTLPVAVLMGSILGLIDLKGKRELTVIKASGISIWRVVRAPAIGLIIVSFIISLGAETLSTQINRQINPAPPGAAALLVPRGEIWLEQQSQGTHYIITATNMQPGGAELGNVTVFRLDNDPDIRLVAERALLQGAQWVLEDAQVLNANSPPRRVAQYTLPTNSTPAEIELKLSSTDDMTFFELADLLRAGVSDPMVRAAAAMRLVKLLALPLVLTGSLLIAFAFTAGYRRSDKYGPAVLYGIVLGFVVFVITEMADRAGSTGVLDPTFAAIGPAFVAIVIGVTVLLYKEDGRA